MSFSVSVPATHKDDARNVLFDLEYPQGMETEHAKTLFDEAVNAAADLIDALSGNYKHVTASLSGHAYTGEANSYTKNSVNVNVSEVDPPIEEKVAA